MTDCCCNGSEDKGSQEQCSPQGSCCTPSDCAPNDCCGADTNCDESSILGRFQNMIGNCLEYAIGAKKEGKPIVGIMCEYTPRELILAAGALPVCMCGGSAATIPDAEKILPANLCPLIKSTFGYHIQQSNPFLEMFDLIVAETTCDGKKKMFEILGQSRTMYVLELTQKSKDADAFEHWIRELHKLKAELELRFNCQITNDKLRDAIKLMNRERKLRRNLASLMKSDSPNITGRELLDLKSIISGIECDLVEYENIYNKIENMVDEQSCCKDKPVRVLLTGVPLPHGSERVLEIIENSGGLVVAQENCTGIKPIYDDIDENADDLIKAIAEKYYKLPCSVMTSNDSRLDLIKKLANEYNADCVIDLTWQACLTYDVESFNVKNFVEDTLKLPYMKIETDYNTSDTGRIALRIEALFESIKSNN